MGHRTSLLRRRMFHKRTLIFEDCMIDKKAIAADERLRQEFNQWAEQGRGERIVHLARTVGTIQVGGMRRAVRGFGSLSHMFRRL